MAKTIITLGREYCTGGRYIAEDVANALGIKLYDKELVTPLDIQKLSPWLRMIGEALHERCVAVLACMGATYIWVDGITSYL